jgi:hypothetical protein
MIMVGDIRIQISVFHPCLFFRNLASFSIPVHFGGLLVDECERGRPGDIGESGEDAVDGDVAVALHDLVSRVTGEPLAQVRLERPGACRAELAEAQSGERWLGLHRNDGRPVKLGAGMALDVRGLAGHEVEVYALG